MLNRRFVSLIAFLAVFFAIGGRPAHSQGLLAGLAVDGIRCEASEGAVEHIHTHLQLFDHGKPVPVPAQIGIPEGAGCLYWVHTHTADGIVHIEAPLKRTFTLGQFFDIWDVDLSRVRAASVRARKGAALRVTVNGRIWNGDPRSIPLRDREEIVIQSVPPLVSGHRADWKNL